MIQPVRWFGMCTTMALDAVERAFAELMGYLAFSSLANDIEVDDINDQLADLLGEYMGRKKNA